MILFWSNQEVKKVKAALYDKFLHAAYKFLLLFSVTLFNIIITESSNALVVCIFFTLKTEASLYHSLFVSL